MLPRIKRVRHLKDYELEIEFTDGKVATLDFQERVVGRGGDFRPLENVEFFSQVVVDAETRTLCWPNGVDLCPDVVYSDATGIPIDELGTELEVTW